jgi:glutamine amidotransferase
VVAETTHGGRFASIVASGRLLGTQFHPERSGADGLALLADFVGLVSHATGSRIGLPGAAAVAA